MNNETYIVQMAEKSVDDLFVRWIDAHQRAVNEISRYRTHFQQARRSENSADRKAAIENLSWAVNVITSVSQNLRLDLVAARVVELKTADDEQSSAKNSLDKTGWMLVVNKTVLPTLKSAREHCDGVQPPRVLHVGSAQACHDRACTIHSGKVNDLITCTRGLPVFSTPDWTYYIVEIKGA